MLSNKNNPLLQFEFLRAFPIYESDLAFLMAIKKAAK